MFKTLNNKILLYLLCIFSIGSILTACRNNNECCTFIIEFHNEYSSLRGLYGVARKSIILKHEQGKIDEHTWELLKQADKEVRQADIVFDIIYKDALYNNSHVFTKQELDTIFKGIEAISNILSAVLVSSL